MLCPEERQGYGKLLHNASKQRITRPMKTPPDITAKMVKLRAFIAEALDALGQERILESVARFAKSQPDIEWEPVALCAAALNEKRRLVAASGAVPKSPSLPVESTPTLPTSISSDALALPCLPGF